MLTTSLYSNLVMHASRIMLKYLWLPLPFPCPFLIWIWAGDAPHLNVLRSTGIMFLEYCFTDELHLCARIHICIYLVRKETWCINPTHSIVCNTRSSSPPLERVARNSVKQWHILWVSIMGQRWLTICNWKFPVFHNDEYSMRYNVNKP